MQGFSNRYQISNFFLLFNAILGIYFYVLVSSFFFMFSTNETYFWNGIPKCQFFLIKCKYKTVPWVLSWKWPHKVKFTIKEMLLKIPLLPPSPRRKTFQLNRCSAQRFSCKISAIWVKEVKIKKGIAWIKAFVPSISLLSIYTNIQ